MENVYNTVTQLADRAEGEVIKIRRDLHMHPELSFQETRTAAVVADELIRLGLEVSRGWAKTGVVGLLHGRRPGRTIALRADMDALPLQEETDLPYKSVHAGVMHACGHDCHTANLLGVAMILAQLRDEFDGTVKFIFQPGEENGGGGREMVKAGVLTQPDVDGIIGLHLWTEPVGYLGFRYGPCTAYSDKITLRIKGKKAHTSTPQRGVDAIVIAGYIITALQSVISRQLDPLEAATFSLGQISGGSAPNIVPDAVEIVGMMRCLTGTARETLKSNIANMARDIAASMGGACEFAFREGYPAVVNDEQMTDLVRTTAREMAAHQAADADRPPLTVKMDQPRLGAEDFGFYSHKVPASFFWVGCGSTASTHSATFLVDERVFKITMPLMAAAALRFLQQK